MGQRLNIEIIKSGKCLANAYYHWSAYTTSSLQMAMDILQQLESKSSDIKDDTLLAIRLLESTGAGITDEERNAIPIELSGFAFIPCAGRNDGLIAISDKGMENTRSWEEGRFSINLDDKSVNFDVLRKSDEADFKEFMGDHPDFDKSKIPQFMGNLKALTADGLIALKEIIDSAQDKCHGYFLNGSETYSSIY